MSYNFTADKRGGRDLQILRHTLRQFVLIEFFPIEVSEELLTLGISIPYKSMDDAQFKTEFEDMMNYLIVKQGFVVTDLFTGKPIRADNISGLAKKISS
ncbi:MAG: hypothetical protein ACK5EA_28860 [Planctomycetaceae bacterium]|jgi:hypothetical protein